MQRAPESGSHKRARCIVPSRTEPRVIHHASTGTAAEVANRTALVLGKEVGVSRLWRGAGGLQHSGSHAGPLQMED